MNDFAVCQMKSANYFQISSSQKILRKLFSVLEQLKDSTKKKEMREREKERKRELVRASKGNQTEEEREIFLCVCVCV